MTLMAGPRGLITPFRRDRKRDFANDDGNALLDSKVLQVIATEGGSNGTSGELPWRTSFGTRIQLLRHRSNDAALGELARVYVRDALRKWVPEATLISVAIQSDGDTLALRVRFRAAGATSEVTAPLTPG
jgi:hypothetical protein